MGQALYRKHRPKSLQEVVGQEHITKTLAQALKQGRLSHAYLFTGPRGVGKTSVARILAHQLNGLPYTDDSSHIDIIEIDAASNRRIDEIRELREKVYMAPVSAKYKVYIIDEVHMLTREAFNALLKTLEEPPAHVVFVLATTDAHKLPDTIVSRTQRFAFRPADATAVKRLLAEIAKVEKFEVSDEALTLIAEHGAGSFRDSVSLLDQAASQGGRVEAKDVQELLGVPSAETLGQLEELIGRGTSSAELMQLLAALHSQGYTAAAIAKHLGQSLRQQIASDSLELPLPKVLALLEKLIEVPASHSPEQVLEIALLQANPTAAHKQPAASQPTAAKATSDAEADAQNETEAKAAMPTGGVATSPLDIGIWPDVLKALKSKHNTLYGVVRMAQPEFDGDTLKLAFAFNFHQKRLKENSNRQKVVDIVHQLTGRSVDIDCVVDKAAKPPKLSVESDNTAPPPDLSAISNIFGSAEVLES